MATPLPANVNLIQLLAASPATALVGTEPFETVQSGTSVACTALQILSFAQANLTTPGLSVLGVTGTASGAVAAITGTADQVLAVNHGGTGLVFGPVNLSTTAAVTGNLALSNLTSLTGLSILGVTGTATGTMAAITGATDQVLAVNHGGTGLVFGPVNLSTTAAVTGNLALSNLTSLTGLSILGVTGTATGTMAAITGTTDQVLVVNHAGTGLVFGAVNLSTSAAVTGVLPNANLANSTVTLFGVGVALGGSYAPATTTRNPSGQPGTSSTTFVMNGLAGSITPNSTGNVFIVVEGSITSSAPNQGGTYQLRVGTGTPPSNGSAAVGSAINTFGYTAGTAVIPFNNAGYNTGMSLGVAYWIDLAFQSSTSAATCTISLPYLFALER